MATSNDTYYYSDLTGEEIDLSLSGVYHTNGLIMSNGSGTISAALLGSDVEAPALFGSSAPDTSTVGVIGQLYFVGNTNLMYICTSISNGYYTWNLVTADKQDVISDLSTIRAGAALGATSVQTETDPTVPGWAKAGSKPEYNSSEITHGETTVAAELAAFPLNYMNEQSILNLCTVLNITGTKGTDGTWTFVKNEGDDVND